MPTVSDVLNAIEQIAPSRLAFSFDKIGLQVGTPSDEVAEGYVCLDVTPEVIERCKPGSIVVAHHPIIWDPIKNLCDKRLLNLARSGASFIACHTNWDVAQGGVNDTLANLLGLENVSPFGVAPESKMVKLVTFVPKPSLDVVIDAISAAGGGSLGEYERCAYYSEGVGTFEPSLSANPAIGQPGEREHVNEFRMEMLVPNAAVRTVEAALRAAHPYEEPAYEFIPITNRAELAIGRIGELQNPISLKEFANNMHRILGTAPQVMGDPDQLVQKVAVIGGAAGDEWQSAKHAGADVYVTGEAKHSTLVDAGFAKFPMILGGHFATEAPAMNFLRARLAEEMPEIEWHVVHPIQFGGKTW